MKIRWFRVLVALAAAGTFAGLLWPVVRSAAPENDLWGMLPMMRHQLEGCSLPQVLRFLLSPAPINFGQPLLKAYLLPAASWGWPLGVLIAAAIGIHFLNSLLVGSVGRMLGLSPWVSGSAAVAYLSLFAHFHAILWPPAAQHLMAVFAILGMLWLYLKTEEQVSDGKAKWRGWFALALVAGAIASLSRSVILAPILILTHLVAVSRSPEERLRCFDRWFPLFALFMIYPSAMLSFVGDSILNDKIVCLPAPPIVKMVVLIGLGLAGLVLIRLWLGRDLGAIWRRLLWIGVPAVWVCLALLDHRQILLPYNGVIPWTALWTSFLNPFQSALGLDSTQPYYYLMAQISPFSLGLSAAGAVLFLGAFAAKNKALWLLPVWYGIALIHLLNHYGSFPVRIPSRYFVYLSPVFAWVFCAAGWWLMDRAAARAGWSGPARRWAWGLTLLVFCVTNLLAIRLAVFRGRLANHYLAYGDLRTAQKNGKDLDSAAAGFRSLEEGNPERARKLFSQGIERRPFLLQYLLGGCRLSDSRWITGGRGLREWMSGIQWDCRDADPSTAWKWEQTRTGVDQDLLDYAVCLYGLSIAEERLGRKAPARYWLSQLYFLEPDLDRLKAWLKADPRAFGDPLPWQKDDYGFGRFMVRLISGVDVQSRADRMSAVS